MPSGVFQQKSELWQYCQYYVRSVLFSALSGFNIVDNQYMYNL